MKPTVLVFKFIFKKNPNYNDLSNSRTVSLKTTIKRDSASEGINVMIISYMVYHIRTVNTARVQIFKLFIPMINDQSAYDQSTRLYQ